LSKKAKRILALLNNPQHRQRLMNSANRVDQDDVGPVGKDDEWKVLGEMNELEEEHGKYMDGLKGVP
jgi:hypothetical protein